MNIWIPVKIRKVVNRGKTVLDKLAPLKNKITVIIPETPPKNIKYVLLDSDM